MILVDTSIWIDHLHSSEPRLVRILEDAQVCVHPMIVGELALGSIHERGVFLALLAELPNLATATHQEVLALVNAHRLFGTGLSLVDAHLLTGLRIDARSALWTRDRRLQDAAARLDIAVL